MLQWRTRPDPTGLPPSALEVHAGAGSARPLLRGGAAAAQPRLELRPPRQGSTRGGALPLLPSMQLVAASARTRRRRPRLPCRPRPSSPASSPAGRRPSPVLLPSSSERAEARHLELAGGTTSRGSMAGRRAVLLPRWREAAAAALGEPSSPSAARADAALQGAAAGCARGGWPRPTWSIAHVHKLLWELRTKGPAVQ